jgi:syntaxin 5
MIVRIKEDIADLNFKCDAAQQFVENSKRQRAMANQAASHNLNVVSSLKSELLNATQGFKTALELRSIKMKDQQEKKYQLAGPSTISPLNQMRPPPVTPEKVTKLMTALPSPYSQMNPYSRESALASDDRLSQLEHQPHQQQQQMLLIQPPVQVQYYEQRQEAIDEVTKTIGRCPSHLFSHSLIFLPPYCAYSVSLPVSRSESLPLSPGELGQLFKRISTMISEQQELVERIDEDIENTVMTSDLAHQALVKTYDSVSNNKTFAMKIIGILFIFLIFFVLFLM